ncbi:MAG: sigma 54-interacting transcriptional regulator [Planctomycetes bacterium]|nr:sigma 54-interacting transcriptional regulator [Planctomycetota bacterium]
MPTSDSEPSTQHRSPLAGLLEELQFGLFRLDAAGRVTEWNDAATRITGHRAAELIGRSCELLDGSSAHGGASCFGAVVRWLAAASTPGLTFAGALQGRSGRAVPVEGAVRLERADDGRVLGATGAIRSTAAARPPVASGDGVPGIVGDSAAMREVARRIRLAAQSDVTTLVRGESGTGKELVARALHELSARRNGPFVAVNIAALPENMLEAELFGHEKGAFTGAVRDRPGLLEAAHGGTLFLDEVAELQPQFQVKLLRALQEREVRRVGGDRPLRFDARLVTATNRDLDAMLRDGRLREDFYYRIKVYEIVVPALRDRLDDLPELVDWFVHRQNQRTGRRLTGVSPAALRALLQHHWPGNVRELQNAVEHAFVMAQGARIELSDLPEHARHDEAPTVRDAHRTAARVGNGDPRFSPAEQRERAQVLAELDAHDWNRVETALALGYSRVTLWKKMRKYGIDEGVFRRR